VRVRDFVRGLILLLMGIALASVTARAQNALNSSLPDAPEQASLALEGPLPRLNAGNSHLPLPRFNLLAAQDHSAAPSTDAPDADDDQPSFMQLLAAHGHHNLEKERWNAYGQFTYIYSWKQAFSAAYTNANGSTNSLLTTPEQSFTGTLTFYLGARLWKGGEVYLVPELISERPLSQLKGLGGAIQNFELQKGGAEVPTFYRSRSYVRQTFGFGGHPVEQESGQQQLGKTDDSRRLVIILGNFSILDYFDKTPFGIDPRQGLFNLSFMTYAAYDFASDARGYSWGGVSELHWDNWGVRYGRITPPKAPNQLPIDFRLFKYFGDQVEAEHKHEIHGQEGTIRLLGYRNHENIGRFSDAVAAFEADPQKNATTCTGFNYGSNNENAPDLCWARKPNVKMGIGIFGEQYVAKDIGVFGRGMYSDGKTEVDAYTSTDRSLSVGSLAKGSLWSRPRDVAGMGVNFGWISKPHVQYLGMGGIDGFIGDGHIRPASETALDVFYSVNFRKSFWLSGDYQHVANPAFNADRGPVNILGVRVHGEF
jgi:high affinity Mn2+ porin